VVLGGPLLPAPPPGRGKLQVLLDRFEQRVAAQCLAALRTKRAKFTRASAVPRQVLLAEILIQDFEQQPLGRGDTRVIDELGGAQAL
jgi:hypothetical protein